MAGASAGDSEFLIEITIDQEKKVVPASAALVTALNSEDPHVRHHAYNFISSAVKKSVTETDSSQNNTVPVAESNNTVNELVTEAVGRPDKTVAVTESTNAVPVANIPTGISCIERQKLPKVWKDNESKALLELRLSREEKFIGANNHKILWENISKRLSEVGVFATGEQCNNKFKSMKKDFRLCKDRNNTSGSSPKFCKFYEEFNEAYGCKASTVPSCTIASFPTETTVCASDTDEHLCKTSSNASLPKKQGKRPRKSVSSASNPVIEYLEGYEKRCEENENKRLKMLKEMHDDRMKLLGRFIDVMEKKK